MEKKLVLKSGKEQSIKRFHPWLFSGAIKKTYGELIEGDLVDIYSNKDEYLATGHYQPGSIAVRILTFTNETIDRDFWKQRFEKAYNLRKETNLAGNSNNNVFRLINAEGDNFPGLIVDFYNGTAVMQFHSVGMYLLRQMFAEILREVIGNHLHAIYDKSENTIPFKADVENKNEYLWGEPVNDVVYEHGNKFRINWTEGQKTGFFIDQRENRKLLAEYSKDKCVLNTFCYTGGFSVYALRGGAKLVHSVDSSAKAIDLTDENIRMNFENAPHESFGEDVFEFLSQSKEKYDVIILDPPAFAKHINALNNALQGYKRLNMKAIEMIKPGGIIFTFSCSQVVSRENFKKSVYAAAANTGRNVRILHFLSAPADHPVNIYHPEGEYLKGLVLYVE